MARESKKNLVHAQATIPDAAENWEKVEKFYDRHSRKKFFKNFLRGNRRVEGQKWFLRRSIARDSRRVLVVGCGSGEICHWLAKNVVRQAEVVGVDLSPNYIEIAQKLFAHRRITYAVANVLAEFPTGPWDVVIFPDVYEHLPATERPCLYANMKSAMGDNGQVLILAPTPAHQRFLMKQEFGLQPVDELVTMDDYRELAAALGLDVTCFLSASVFRRYDYNYVVIEKCEEVCETLRAADKLALRSWPEHPRWSKIGKVVHGVIAPKRLRQAWKANRLAHAMGDATLMSSITPGRCALASVAAMVLIAGGLFWVQRLNAQDRSELIDHYINSRANNSSELLMSDAKWLETSGVDGASELDMNDVEGTVSHLLDANEDYFLIDEEQSGKLDRIDSRDRLVFVREQGDYVLYRDIASGG